MTDTAFPRVRGLDVVRFVLPAALALAAVVALARFGEVSQMLRVVRRASPWWFAAACMAQLMHYWCQSWLFRVCYDFTGWRTRALSMFGAVLGFTALNRLLPSAGAAGTSYVVTKTTEDGVPPSSGVMAVGLTYILDYATFLSFIAAALLYLLVHHQLKRSEVLAFVALLVMMGAMTGAMALAVRAQALLQRFGRWVAEVWSMLSRGRSLRIEPLLAIAARLEEDWQRVSSVKANVWKSFPPSYLMHALDVLTVYLLFPAFGVHAHVGVVTAGCAVAWLLSLASMVPSGLGVFEVSLPLIFKSYGLPFETAVVVTVAYRLISFWLPIPAGLAAIAWHARHLKVRSAAV